ncbi:MAG TPA: hypothetical protein VE860_06910 [Chthoniobacterales bacterium]|nr:hypothetical protein [Chthoniobacterales bacterium]
MEVWPPWLQIQNLPALQASCNGKLQIKLEAVSAALEDGYEVVFELAGVELPPPVRKTIHSNHFSPFPSDSAQSKESIASDRQVF